MKKQKYTKIFKSNSLKNSLIKSYRSKSIDQTLTTKNSPQKISNRSPISKYQSKYINNSNSISNYNKIRKSTEINKNNNMPVTAKNKRCLIFTKIPCSPQNSSTLLSNRMPKQKLDEESLQSQIKSLLKLSKENKEISDKAISKIKSKNIKESLIISLKKDCKNSTFEAQNKQELLSILSEIREMGEQNNEEMHKYCDKIKERFKSFILKFENYEKKIKELTLEKEKLTDDYAELQVKKNAENKNLIEQLQTIKEKMISGEEELNTLNQEYELLSKTKEEERLQFLDNEANDAIKYNTQLKKYNELLHSYNLFEFQDNIYINDITGLKKNFESNFYKENLCDKLSYSKNKNEALEKELKDINRCISNYNESIENKEKNRSINFCGTGFEDTKRNKSCGSNINTNVNSSTKKINRKKSKTGSISINNVNRVSSAFTTGYSTPI